jgi:hypothetical protein
MFQLLNMVKYRNWRNILPMSQNQHLLKLKLDNLILMPVHFPIHHTLGEKIKLFPITNEIVKTQRCSFGQATVSATN